MTALIIPLLAAVIWGLYEMARAVLTAPYGEEDETGYHETKGAK